MNCRVCGSPKTATLGTTITSGKSRYEIVECTKCGCRSSEHQHETYERLHSTKSTYKVHTDIAEPAEAHFKAGSTSKLRAYLSKTSKNRFIINFAGKHTELSKIAEIGCSQGYLTSYFILDGRSIDAYDISPTAVRSARKRFGAHFYEMSFNTLKERGEYDLIFHAGTIGCVNDPIEFTQSLLESTKKGGYIIFNAPNLDSLKKTRSIWHETLPPDLVTSFPPSFWLTNFHRVADVQTFVENLTLNDALTLRINNRHHLSEPENLSKKRTKVLKSCFKLALRLSLGSIRSNTPAPYGVHIVLRKK